MSIRVLHVLTTTAGGLGQVVYDMVRGLDSPPFRVAVAFGPGYPMDQRFRDLGIPVYPVRMRRGLNPMNLLGFLDLLRLLRRERFDVVHAHSSIAGVLARVAARLAGTRLVVFTLHGYATLDFDRSPLRPLYWAIEKVADRCTDGYAAICRYVKDTWVARGLVTADRVAVIYNGVDQDRFPPVADSRGARQALGLPSDGPLIGTVGLHEVQKGTRYLIEAMATIVREVPECHLVLIGDGPLRQDLEALAQRLGIRESVHFLGWRNEAAQLMGLFDVFCLPSLQEGFSIALLEAMVQARPIVATGVAGNPEAVLHRETGLIVPPGNPEALASAILSYLREPALGERLGRAGRTRLMREFTIHSMQQGYRSFYERLLKGGRA